MTEKAAITTYSTLAADIALLSFLTIKYYRKKSDYAPFDYVKFNFISQQAQRRADNKITMEV